MDDFTKGKYLEALSRDGHETLVRGIGLRISFFTVLGALSGASIALLLPIFLDLNRYGLIGQCDGVWISVTLFLFLATMIGSGIHSLVMAKDLRDRGTFQLQQWNYLLKHGKFPTTEQEKKKYTGFREVLEVLLPVMYTIGLAIACLILFMAILGDAQLSELENSGSISGNGAVLFDSK